MYKQQCNQKGKTKGKRGGEVWTFVASHTQELAIYLQAEVLARSFLSGKKEVKQRDKITQFERIAFHTCGPEPKYAGRKKTHTASKE